MNFLTMDNYSVKMGCSQDDCMRLLRCLDEPQGKCVAGINGDKILLRCKNDTEYALWCEVWAEYLSGL